jgi:DNA segregation ATPase FtsK/SpoIIIE, S-DNA-T family
MSKNKKRSEEKPKQFVFAKELNGLLLMLIAIIGLGPYGPVGELISNFAMFLVGAYYIFLLVIVLLIGIYIVLKREYPNFFTVRLVGLYLFVIGLLALAHLNYVKLNDIKVVDIFKETISDFMNATKHPSSIVGGGIIGASFSTLFVKMFDLDGTNIISFSLMLFGVILFANISIVDKTKWLFSKVASIFKREKDNSEEVKNAEDNYDNNKKIVISSIEELTEINEHKNEPKEKEEVATVVSPQVSSYSHSYILPSMDLLNMPPKAKGGHDPKAIEKNIEILERVLNDFGLIGKVVEVNIGPSVTQYEMELKAGTKVSKLLSIHREISLALAAKDVRIQAPIPGKNTVGIELPNTSTTMVTVREILESVPSNMSNSKLLVILGKNIMGRPIYAEINNTPHLLVAGSTGSGKSVCINCIIASILMRTRPDEVKLLLVDPKKVELSSYNGVPHLMAPVVTDPKKAAIALRKIVSEMDSRYDTFNQVGVKNIAGYNSYIENKNKSLSEGGKLKIMPYIVVIVDELADLMLVAAKEVEESITRITQLARAAGIHLIVATQRPSTDVITGLIKANIPSRISFAVSSSIDSRTILDMTGAEKLLGKGDMLFLPMGENTPLRVQGAYISEDEIKRIIDHTVEQQKAEYDDKLTKLEEKEVISNSSEEAEEYDDPLYNDIVEFVITTGKVSASLLQRKYRLGYNRAARIVDLLEERGIIGPVNGSKPREVLVKLENNNDYDDEE